MTITVSMPRLCKALFIAARDGTRAFVTGEFNDAGLVDDVTGLTLGQMLELEHWIKFYDSGYLYKGECPFFTWMSNKMFFI